MGNIVAILQIIPALIATIQAIEAAIPGNGQGKAKLDAVISIMQAVNDTVKQLPLEQIIGTLVNLFNNTGVFKK